MLGQLLKHKYMVRVTASRSQVNSSKIVQLLRFPSAPKEGSEVTIMPKSDFRALIRPSLFGKRQPYINESATSILI